MKRVFFLVTFFGVLVPLWFINKASSNCMSVYGDPPSIKVFKNNPSKDVADAIPLDNNRKKPENIPHQAMSVLWEPTFLDWHESPVEIPADWQFHTPKYCKNYTGHFNSTDAPNRSNKIIVHYHLQHNAGTSFYEMARDHLTDECATRCCHQKWKHCVVSFNETVEAENIRHNYEYHGVQYVSYELMLPPRFPMPFVSEGARQGLYFTTIVRDPLQRFLTYLRRPRFNYHGNAHDAESPFWNELSGRQKIYSPDNLNVRWLSGAMDQITVDHINIAKCRLQLFDLVISDTLFNHATRHILCPLNNWNKGKHCSVEKSENEYKPKSDALEGTNPHFIGAWIERLKPSFEIYDYARILSLKHMDQHGVSDFPDLSEDPSYLQALERYANMTITESHFGRIPQITLQNEDHFHPPKDFCDNMKKVWTSNPDVVPNVVGIGTIKSMDWNDMFF
ncbi:hypothetical protein ACHAXS_006697 [Conticribra weissflogii]